MSDLAATIGRIIEFPRAWPSAEANTRRVLLGDFPYQLVYRVEGDEVRVYAVAHLKRKPGYWLERVGT